MKNDSKQPTPVKTTGEPQLIASRPAARDFHCDKASVDSYPVTAPSKGTHALATSMPHNANEALAFRRKGAWEPPAATNKHRNLGQAVGQSRVAFEQLRLSRSASSVPAATSMLKLATLSIAP